MGSQSRHCSELGGGQSSKEELVFGSHSGQGKPNVPGAMLDLIPLISRKKRVWGTQAGLRRPAL